MQETYEAAITRVFKDEGGYTNESTDPGGPTNWGITIADAREYWKPDATAQDVKEMPKDVAEGIYLRHYATPVRYDSLPAGIDYSVLDYSINSGRDRAVKLAQHILGVEEDGIIGDVTLAKFSDVDPIGFINHYWDARLAYLQSLTHLWHTYGHGWTIRVLDGKRLALILHERYKTKGQ